MPPATKTIPKAKVKPTPTPAPQARVKGEHQIFTDLLDEVRSATDFTENPLLLENEELYGTVRLYDLLHLYCENEFEKEVMVRQEDRKALAEITDLQTQRHLRIVKSHQAVLRFYRWLADQGFVSRKDYGAVLALAKDTLNTVLA